MLPMGQRPIWNDCRAVGNCIVVLLPKHTFVSYVFENQRDSKVSSHHGGKRFEGTWMSSIPIPLPRNYVVGIDLQRKDLEKSHQPSYLRGEFREKGWWYYYIYALAI